MALVHASLLCYASPRRSAPTRNASRPTLAARDAPHGLMDGRGRRGRAVTATALARARRIDVCADVCPVCPSFRAVVSYIRRRAGPAQHLRSGRRRGAAKPSKDNLISPALRAVHHLRRASHVRVDLLSLQYRYFLTTWFARRPGDLLMPQAASLLPRLRRRPDRRLHRQQARCPPLDASRARLHRHALDPSRLPQARHRDQARRAVRREDA